jgi:hypothetical protein
VAKLGERSANILEFTRLEMLGKTPLREALSLMCSHGSPASTPNFEAVLMKAASF